MIFVETKFWGLRQKLIIKSDELIPPSPKFMLFCHAPFLFSPITTFALFVFALFDSPILYSLLWFRSFDVFKTENKCKISPILNSITLRLKHVFKNFVKIIKVEHKLLIKSNLLNSSKNLFKKIFV